jgi:hypothetical protein
LPSRSGSTPTSSNLADVGSTGRTHPPRTLDRHRAMTGMGTLTRSRPKRTISSVWHPDRMFSEDDLRAQSCARLWGGTRIFSADPTS